MPFLPIPSPLEANMTFGCFINQSFAFLFCSCTSPSGKLMFANVNAINSYPSSTQSGIAVYSLIVFFSSFCLILVIVGCETPRIFASSLSLLLEFLINSNRSLSAIFFLMRIPRDNY